MDTGNTAAGHGGGQTFGFPTDVVHVNIHGTVAAAAPASWPAGFAIGFDVASGPDHATTGTYRLAGGPGAGPAFLSVGQQYGSIAVSVDTHCCGKAMRAVPLRVDATTVGTASLYRGWTCETCCRTLMEAKAYAARGADGRVVLHGQAPEYGGEFGAERATALLEVATAPDGPGSP